ncbi:MAG: GNAT family N-acetyltransferase [Chlamydiota bacterium]
MKVLFFLIAFTLYLVQTTASEMIIRPIRGEDWENFRQIRLRSLQENPKAYGIAEADEVCLTELEWKAICQDAQDGKGKWYVVAECEGKLIGMLGAVEIFGAHMRHQVEIIQAYVVPSFRRHELMTKLFVALREQLQKVDHLEQMIAWVTLHEDQMGKTMFEKFGFNLAGTLTKTVKYEGRYYDCCWLEAPLRDCR